MGPLSGFVASLEGAQLGGGGAVKGGKLGGARYLL